MVRIQARYNSGSDRTEGQLDIPVLKVSSAYKAFEQFVEIVLTQRLPRAVPEGSMMSMLSYIRIMFLTLLGLK